MPIFCEFFILSKWTSETIGDGRIWDIWFHIYEQ